MLYGGSVTPGHTRAYLETEYVDGLLVGTASLNQEDFATIVTAAAELG
ncbi:MAG TPA: triose-phosphate isomerase [Candidatus Saccharimonadia bacterium]